MISKRSNTASAKGRDALCVPVQKVKDMEEVSDNGRSVPDGLSPFGSSQQAVSPVPASIPSAGDWVLFRRGVSYQRVAVEMKQADKVTPRIVRFVGTGYPRQCGILEIVASFADKATAERVRDSIGGIAGEYERRRRAAQDELSARLTAAITAANQQVRRAIAQAIEARSAETQSGSVADESAVAKPCAQGDAA